MDKENIKVLSTKSKFDSPDDSNNREEQEKVDSLDLNEKPELARADVPDKQMRMFSSLTKDDRPLVPYPNDSLSDINYPQFHEPRCAICTSPFRDLAEHVYLEAGRKPQSVINFFSKHFNAKLNWVQVDTHMQMHVDFKKIVTSGLKNYEMREEEVALWKYREHDLALTALLVELDDVRGIDCSKNAELKIKRASMVERLVSRIMDLKNERDSQGALAFNIFEILLQMHDDLECEPDKRKIRDKIKELKEKLQNP